MPEWIGRFHVLERLGMGGVGEVYKVIDPSLDRTVALKVLKADGANHDHLVKSFFREAKLAGSLEHPGIVPLHEFGTLPDGRPYLTMRIISGRTLAEEMRAAEPGEQSRARFLEILLAVAKTLAFAHARRVVHGDLKPQNVMVGAFGEIQVIDWGFARALSESRVEPNAKLARVLGTPAYMAPEQARGDQVRIDARTDVFGLGAILHEILTGDPPNQGSSRSETVRVATESSHANIAARLSACGADQELVALGLLCLEPDTERRPHDAAAVVASLSHYLAGVSDRVRRAELAAERATAIATHERRTRKLVMALAVMLLILVSAVGYVWLRLERERAQQRRANDVEAARAIEEGRNAAKRAADSQVGLERAEWDRANDAVRRAVSLVREKEVAGDLVRAATDLESRVHREIERNEIAVRTLARLESLHHRSIDDPDSTGLEAEFMSAFREHGIDVATGDTHALASRIRSDLIAGALIMGLDNWVHVQRMARRADWTALADIVIACETNDWRLAVRRAGRMEDASALRAIAEREDVREQPASSRLLLARNLLDVGERAAALNAYRSARVDYPGDFWLCHDYAMALSLTDDASRQEVIRLFSMANALRPNDVHTLIDLGRALSMGKEFEAARALLERAVSIDPQSGRAWLVLSPVYGSLGQGALGIAASKRAFELGVPAAGLALSDHHIANGRIAKAAEVLRATVDAYPDDPVILLSYARLEVSLFDIVGAATQFDRIIAKDPQHLEAKICRAYCSIQLGDWAQAIERLEPLRTIAITRNEVALAKQATEMLGAARDAERVSKILRGPAQVVEDRLFGPERSNGEIFSNILGLLTVGRSLLAAKATEAMLSRPGTQSGFGLRFTGARAAARLALGEGLDAEGMGVSERGSWWRKATDWLAADVAELESRCEAGSIARKELRSLLDSWGAEPALTRLGSLSLADHDDVLTAWRGVRSRLEELRSRVEADG